MKEKKETGLVESKIAKAVCKLISEEYYAYQLYLFSGLSVKKEDLENVDQLFAEIGKDELNDHMKQLIAWCREYEVEVPASESEFKKLADVKAVKLVSGLKKNKDAVYYINEAIKSEEIAIESYKKALEIDGICLLTDLQSLLWHIYYDECEHLDKLNTSKIAVEAGDDLVIGY